MPSKSLAAFALCCAISSLVGCLPSWSVDWADRDAYGTIREGQDAVLGRSVDFDIEYAPVDSYEFLDGIDTSLEGDPDLPVMTLENALKVAFRNSRTYQSRKEDLYSSALSFATLSRGWTTLLFTDNVSGVGEAAYTQGGGPEAGPDNTGQYINANGGVSLAKRFVGGGLLTLGASLSYAIDLLDGSDSELFGSLVSATFTQPLLRGAWRNLAYEEQYRRERDFLLEVFEFDRFRQTFAVSILRGYYGVLRGRDQLENGRTSVRRLKEAYDVTRVLADGGQVSPIQKDQAEQDYLNAQIALEVSLLTYSGALDSFKITLGLPISTEMRLDYPGALNSLRERLITRDAAESDPFPLTEFEAVDTALSTDTDLLRVRARARDTEKDVEIAADNFFPRLLRGPEELLGTLKLFFHKSVRIIQNERLPKNVIDMFPQDYFEIFFDAVGDFLEVFFIVPRNEDSCNVPSMGGNKFLFQPTDRQYFTS